MKVTVRFFASYRERVGKRSLSVKLDDKATVGDLISYVDKTFPGFAPHPERVVVAVNEEYVSHSQRLKDGDEAAFIPPVSGGAGNARLVSTESGFRRDVQKSATLLTGGSGGVPQFYFLPLPKPRKGQGDGRMPEKRGAL